MARAYKAKWIVTASSEVLENHMLIVDDGQVIDIIPNVRDFNKLFDWNIETPTISIISPNITVSSELQFENV